jgi:hypothetical protein
MTARRSDETSVVLMHLVDAFDLHIAEFEIVNNGEVLLAGHNFHHIVLFSEHEQVLQDAQDLGLSLRGLNRDRPSNDELLAQLNEQFSGRDHRQNDLFCQ